MPVIIAKYLLVTICAIWCITLVNHSKSFLPTNTNGRPGCQTEEEMSTRYWRDNNDPTRYWECVTRYQDGVCRGCDQETLFWDEIKLCIPVAEWEWRETVDPPSPPQNVGQCLPETTSTSTTTSVTTTSSTTTTKKPTETTTTTKQPTTTNKPATTTTKKTSTTTKKPTTTTTMKTTTTKKPTTTTTMKTTTTKKPTTTTTTTTTKKTKKPKENNSN